MVYFVRSATIDFLSMRDALDAGKEITKFVNENYPELQFQMLTSKTGRLGRIAWISKHESMKAAAEDVETVSSSPEYLALNQKWYGKSVVSPPSHLKFG